MTNQDFARGVQKAGSGLTIVGAIVLVACVIYLTVGWWNDQRWGWVAVGIAVVLVNIVLVGLQFRRPKAPATAEPESPDLPDTSEQ